MVWGWIGKLVKGMLGSIVVDAADGAVLDVGWQRLMGIGDPVSQQVLHKRLEFEAKMELYRQGVRAKERQEDQDFRLELQRLEGAQLLQMEEMRQQFQSLEAEKQRQFTEAIEKFKADLQVALHQDTLAFQRWKEETGRQFAIELKWLDARIDRLLAKEAREADRRDRHSPIFAVTDDILAQASRTDRPPLSIFISPPVLRFDPQARGSDEVQFPMMESTLSAALRDLCKQYNQRQRPVMLHAGEWVTNARRAESAARDLFRSLRTVPVVIVETEVEESFMNLNLGFWHSYSPDVRFDTVVRKFRWPDALEELYEQHAQTFQTTKGIAPEALTPRDRAKLERKSREDLTHYIEVLHVIHTAMLMDEYFLLYAEPRQLPLLPEILSDILAAEALPPEAQVTLLQQAIEYGHNLLDALGQVEPLVVAEMRLAWAQKLGELPERHGFEGQLKVALREWATQRGGEAPGTEIGELVAAVNRLLLPEDAKFVSAVNGCLATLAVPVRLDIATACYDRGLGHFDCHRYDWAVLDLTRAISLNPCGETYYQRARAHVGLGDWSSAIADLDRVLSLQPQRSEAYELRGDAYAKLQNVEAALANYAEALKYGSGTVQRKREELQAHWLDRRSQETAAATRRQAEEAERQRQAAAAEAKRQQEEAERQAEEHRQMVEACLARGQAKLDSEDYQGAIADLTEAIRLQPDHGAAYFQRGLTNIILEDYKKAIADYTEAIRLQPDHGAAYFQRGLANIILEDYKKAIADLTEAIRLQPDDADVYFFRGKAKLDSEDYQGAIADYTEAIRLQPDYTAAYFQRGLANIILEDYKKAIADLTEAIRLQPDDADVYFFRGKAKLDSEDYQGAIADYTEAIRLQPDYTAAYFQRGLANIILEDYKKGIADLTEAIRLQPNYTAAYFQRGKAKLDSEDYQGAIADLTEAIRLQPDDAYAYYSRGFAKSNLGDNQGAIADLTEVIRLQPDNADVYCFRGKAKLFGSEDYQGAIADFSQTIHLQSDNADAYLFRGLAKEQSEDYRGAIRDFEQVILLQPDNADAYFFRGKNRAKLENYEEAIADFDQTIRLQPDDANAYFQRGLAKFNLGDYEEAIADFGQAIRLEPDNADAYLFRGLAKSKLAEIANSWFPNYQRAIGDLRKAAQLYQQQGNFSMYQLALEWIRERGG